MYDTKLFKSTSKGNTKKGDYKKCIDFQKFTFCLDKWKNMKINVLRMFDVKLIIN